MVRESFRVRQITNTYLAGIGFPIILYWTVIQTAIKFDSVSNLQGFLLALDFEQTSSKQQPNAPGRLAITHLCGQHIGS